MQIVKIKPKELPKDLVFRLNCVYEMELGEFVAEATAEVTECVRYYGGYLLAWLAVALAWLLLAVTMPAWYLPYKHFTGKGVEG